MVSPDTSDRPLIYRGLTSQQVLLNRRHYGSNVLTPPQQQPWWSLYLEKFNDPVIRILIIAAILALAIGWIEQEYAEALGILVAIFLATTLAFINEYQANKAFDLLNNVYDQTPVKVIRDNKFTQVSRQDLVVGDLVYIEQGDEVPADGELLEAVGLLMDQAKITGESKSVKKFAKLTPQSTHYYQKTYPSSQVYRSTIVAQGHGVFRVTAVGDHSEIGQLAQAVISIEEGALTPLNIQLEKLSQLIGIIGLLVASLTFSALLLQGFLTHTINLNLSQLYLLCLIIISGLFILIPVWFPIIEDGFKALDITFDLISFSLWKRSLVTGLIILVAGLGFSYCQ